MINDPIITDFLERARKLHAGVDRLALARDFGLSPVGLSTTLAFLAAMDRNEFQRRTKELMMSETSALPRRAGRTHLTLALAATAIDELSETCTPAEIDTLLDGSSDKERDLWIVAINCRDTSAFVTALSRAHKSRSALLWQVRGWTNTDPDAELAAADMYLRPEMTGVLPPGVRNRFVAAVVRSKLASLYGLGMIQEGLAFADSQDPAVLKLALHLPTDSVRTEINGFPYYEQSYQFIDNFRTEHAAALALAGRRDEALRLLDSIVDPQARSKATACLDAAGDNCLSGSGDPLTADVLAVDQFLRDPGADPYVLLEARVGDSSSSNLISEILCRLTGGEDKEVCRRAQESERSARSGNDDPMIGDEDRRLWKQMATAFGPPFDQARSRYKALLASYGTEPKEKAQPSDRASVEPEKVRFREALLPASASGPRPKKMPVPKGTAPLPDGFTMVRFERDGQRAAAVSISPLLDPDGEVSAGGYWLHLSDDGGKHWGTPLYTGLAEYFPYIVPSSSRLPMLAGDHIHLEVEEALIDTASITYPPVGTRTLRRRKGIYLDIPIADLTADSDRDGLSDIAAHHLLLDEPIAARPFVVGRDKSCAAPSSETMARLEILKQLYKVEVRALIEPVDRPASDLFGLWRKSDVAARPPIFLEGNPDDYRCVDVDRLMIVYRPEDRDRLRRLSPDFQLVSLPPITWNRTHTRGFLNWSMGWTGGTFRLVKTGDGWKLTSISSWIT